MNEAPAFDPRLRIEFAVRDEAALQALSTMLAALQREKLFLDEVEATGVDVQDVCAEPRWLDLLNGAARRSFAQARELSGEEAEVYQRLWNLTAPEVRLGHPMFCFSAHWDFESVLDAILNGDYVLLGVESDGPRAVLLYHPAGLPFGGSEALVQLVEAFGHSVTFDQWHGGPHLRSSAGWDFEAARRLVERGQGVAR